jgi:hypothetical protein
VSAASDGPHEERAAPGPTGPLAGPLAEEAARLADAVRAWSRSAGGASHHGGAPAGADTAPGAAAGGCALCPFCQLLGMLRTARPEVYAHLADAGSSLAAALREFVSAAEKEWAARPTPRAERIDIDSDSD